MEVLWSLVGLLVVFLVAFHIWFKRAEKRWTVIDQGFYLSVEYGYDTATHRAAGMANHSTHVVRFDVTVIRFSDGRTRVLKGRYSMVFPSGSRIRILRNDVGDVILEDARTNTEGGS